MDENGIKISLKLDEVLHGCESNKEYCQAIQTHMTTIKEKLILLSKVCLILFHGFCNLGVV